MKYKELLRLEAKKLLNKRYFIPILLFLVLAGYFLHSGIGRYKSILEEKENFLNLESKKFDRIFTIPQYCIYGEKILFVPSPMIGFSDIGPIPEFMTAFIDSSERIGINHSLKGQSAFSGLTSLFWSFSGFLLLFGSFLSMLYGFMTFKDHEYFKFLESVNGSRIKLFSFFLGAKSLLLFFVCMVLISVSILIFLLNGISVNIGGILVYGLSVFMLFLCFLLIGIETGSLKSKFTGEAVAVASWFFLAFLLPVLICQWTYSRAGSIGSPFKMETQKQTLFMEYERDAFEKLGKFDDSKSGNEAERKMFLDFWNGGFKKIMQLEGDMLQQVKMQGTFYSNLSGCFPTSFFLSLSSEMSSGGYRNLIKFQEHSLQLKKDFIWFIANISILSNIKDFEPFLKKEEHIFQGQSRLPENFLFGLAVTVLWLAGLLFLSWLAFSRMLDRHPMEGKAVAGPKPEEIKKNRITFVFTNNSMRRVQLLSKLNAEKKGLVSVLSPSSLPKDVRVKNLLQFFGLPFPEALNSVAKKYCGSLSLDDQARIILEIIRPLPAEYVIFNDFLMGQSEDFKTYFSSFLEGHKKDRRIAYFSNSLYAATVCTDNISYNMEEHPV